MNKDVRRGYLGGLLTVLMIVAVVACAVHLARFERDTAFELKSVNAYIGACQRLGYLPTVDQLNAAVQKAQAAKEAKR